MARITRQSNGRKLIQFVAGDGRRKTIRLGKVPQRFVEEVRVRVEQLNVAMISRCPIDNDTANWVARLGDEMTAKLAAVGLIPERANQALEEFLKEYSIGRPDVKVATRTAYHCSAAHLIYFFGAKRNMREITEADADAFLVFLRTKPYALATIGRTIRHAKQFFRAAVRANLLCARTPSRTSKPRGRQTRLVVSLSLEKCPVLSSTPAPIGNGACFLR